MSVWGDARNLVALSARARPTTPRTMSSRNEKSALIGRVFVSNAAVVLAGVLVLALTPLTVSWPLETHQAIALAGWTLGVLLAGYLISRAFLRPPRRTARGRAGYDALTLRELVIVCLIAEGYTTREIAETLFISPKTVDGHRHRILHKLGLRDRVAVARYAIRHGLIEA
jgi:DNA-binding CsgD family transcriptional regulator